MAIDFQKLKANNDIVDVVGNYVRLSKKGSEHVGMCPFHNEKNPSLQVNPSKQIFKCFGCGKGGDVFDFLMAYGKTLPEAVAILEGNAALIPEIKKRQANLPKRTLWKPLKPKHPASVFTHYRHGEPSRTWAYHDAEGSILGYVCRFDTPEGKEVIPYSFCTDGSRQEWRWQGLDVPRPLYNLHLLAQHPEKTVVLVEGEKCADAVSEAMPTAVAVCWIGGSKGIKNADWTPLYGRRVIYWPDNHTQDRYGEKHPKAGELKPFHEQDGNAAMLAIDAILSEHCPTRKWLNVPAEMPHKWDAADKEWQPNEMRKFVLERLYEVPSLQPIETPPPPPTMQEELTPAPMDMDEEPPLPPNEEGEDENPYFRFLGYINDNGRPLHCFFAVGSKLIVRLGTSSMTTSSLLDLAPLNFWEHRFPARSGKSKFDVTYAANWLSQVSQQSGIFADRLIRGRGAWHDDGRTVIHSGTKLIVDGAEMPLGNLRTRYIYEIGEPLGFSSARPLAPKAASRLLEVTRLINWERDINAYLFTGWCVVAPICGALKWRPHIWVTGGAGTGKSWIFQMIVRRLLGETAIAVQGETSEAGVRQSLRHDALPVVFDEAEGEDKRSQDRIQTVLTLMRSASAEDGGVLAKGSAGGNAVTYRIRSCFAFASIGVSLSQQSDRSRVTLLAIKNLQKDDPIKHQRWEELQRLYNEIMTDDFIESLQARTLMMVPIIIKNALTFANAAASVIGAQRAGDQLGALLAGVYSLFSSNIISYEDAVKWVSDKDWNEERGLDQTRDEQRLFTFLMEQITRVETGEGVKERQIGELFLTASLNRYDPSVNSDLAIDRLRRLGFKLDETKTKLVISNDSDSIAKMLRNTPWGANPNRILLRIDGAEAVPSTTFASGVKARAVSIPLSLLTK